MNHVANVLNSQNGRTLHRDGRSTTLLLSKHQVVAHSLMLRATVIVAQHHPHSYVLSSIDKGFAQVVCLFFSRLLARVFAGVAARRDPSKNPGEERSDEQSHHGKARVRQPL